MAKSTAPANETPEQRFVRLANIRAANAINALGGIGKLTGRQYVSTPEQHKKLFDHLRLELDKAERSLTANKPATREKARIL